MAVDRVRVDMTKCATRIPIVSIVGKGDSGKTTLLEGVLAELAARGWRVATVKHHVHDFDIDVPGKDSYRHARAGAVVTMVSSPERFGMVREMDRELSLDELAEAAGDVDILITEGYKRAAYECIEVSRLERSAEPICTDERLRALVTDNAALAAAAGVPVFDLSDAIGVAAFIEATYLRPGARDGD